MKNLRYDLPASIVVYLVALPLCLGIALASGAPLLAGIISGIIGGILVGAISGSHSSVSGPAAGLAAVVSASIITLGGFELFSVALLLAGVLQLLGGVFKGGFIAAYIPTNVIKGLLAAIGILLILKQVPHALGYDPEHEDAFAFIQPDGENTISHLLGSSDHLNYGSIVISIIGMLILIGWNRIPFPALRKLPASLAVVVLGVGLNELFRSLAPALYIQGEHLVRLPITEISTLFNVHLPSLDMLGNYQVWVVAFTIAIVASLETMLNIEAVDNQDPHKRESPPNRELVAQGIGNMAAGVLGGIPVTSVIVRSSVNLDSGARTKVSTILHGVLLLVSILTLTSVINRIPLAALAAVLIMTGYKLAKLALFKEMYRKGGSQFIPFMVTVVAIIFTDLLVGVLIGLAVAIFYLLRSNFRNPFILQKHDTYNNETIRIELPNQVTFLNKATIKSTLWSIPENSKVIIDASKTDFIDDDIVEIIQTFRTVVAPEKGIKLNLLGLKGEYELQEYIEFIDVLDKRMRDELTPERILAILKEGNQRFADGNWSKKEFKHQVDATSGGQFPMAVVLSCIDSRTTPEVIFDSNLGELITIRIAGNIVTDEIIGSMELSHREIGTKLIVILGHANCGAVNAAIHGLGGGYVDLITGRIASSIEAVRQMEAPPQAAEALLDAVCRWNAEHSKVETLRMSPFLSEQVRNGGLGVVSAYYDTASGIVSFSELTASDKDQR